MNDAMYGMFSKAGDAMVHGIVLASRSAKLNWNETYDLLCQVGKIKGFTEANDTAVREAVYLATQDEE